MLDIDMTRTRAAARKPGAPPSRRLLLSLLGVIVGAFAFAPCSALALNPERHYEMVSPVFKGGFGVIRLQAVSAHGESAMFYSPGAFAGAPAGPNPLDYLSRRGATKWETVPLMAPAGLIADWEESDVSPSLGTVFTVGRPGPDSENSLHVEDMFLHQADLPDTFSEEGPSGWERVGEVGGEAFSEKDADPDFCHVLFGTGGTSSVIYELTRGCNGEHSSLAAVAVNNEGQPIKYECDVNVGIEDYAFNGSNTFNAIDMSGDEVFFTTCLSGQSSESKSPHQLFMRLGGARTVEVSKPVSEGCAEVPCAGAAARASAEFSGASEDGSRVFFTAPLAPDQPPLVEGDTDASNNLYMARIGCPQGKQGCSAGEREVVSLSEVSHDLNGGAADVDGVVRVAPDGQRAYFVAGGELLTDAQRQALEREGRPVPHVGAENLYVYDDTGLAGTVAFIGDLCSGKELSGSVEDVRCPSTASDARLWSSDISDAQTVGPEGGFLVFATYAQLSADDTNAAPDVYRYDVQTGVLERISTGENGFDANGNGGVSGSSILLGNHGVGQEDGPVRDEYELGNRAGSEDGSRIVFVSSEPLSPSATNGLTNAYEWHEAAGGSGGSVSLISSGSGGEAVDDVAISADGSGVFFDTSEGLVPQDTDGAPDLYDARLGEGFPAPAAVTEPCEGDACQGPLTNPAPLLVPGSVSQQAGENLAPVVAGVPVEHKSATKPKPKSKPKQCKRGFRRDKRGKCVKVGKASRVTVARRGRLSTSSRGV